MEMKTIKIPCVLNYRGTCAKRVCTCGGMGSANWCGRTHCNVGGDWYSPKNEPEYINCENCVYRIFGESGDDILFSEWGIKIDTDKMEIRYPDDVNLQMVWDIINGAYNIADGHDVGDVKYPTESHQYYKIRMWDEMDDTAFDYHGSYLMGILEFMMHGTTYGDVSPMNHVIVKIPESIITWDCFKRNIGGVDMGEFLIEYNHGKNPYGIIAAHNVNNGVGFGAMLYNDVKCESVIVWWITPPITDTVDKLKRLMMDANKTPDDLPMMQRLHDYITEWFID